MTLYDIFMIPLENIGIKKARKELIPNAKGTVLEVGSGTGVNLKYYNFDNIEKLILSDLKLSKRLLNNTKVTTIEASADRLPFDDETFDYVIATLVFCSVKDVINGLTEIERVLKVGGSYIFIEHVLPKKKILNWLFRFFAPLWKRVASGCHLNRDFIKSLHTTNFAVETYHYFGRTVLVSGISSKKA